MVFLSEEQVTWIAFIGVPGEHAADAEIFELEADLGKGFSDEEAFSADVFEFRHF